MYAQDAPAAKLGLELSAQQLLKLVGLDTEGVGLKAAIEFHAVGDDS